MTLAKGPDPTKPMLTFDNYVIPDTVREVRKPTKRMTTATASPVGSYFSYASKPAKKTVGWPLWFGVTATFLLGVASTLYFVQPPSASQLAAVAQPMPRQVPAQPQLDPVEVVVDAQPSEALTDETADLKRAVSASLENVVTRQESADLIAPAGTTSKPDLTPLTLSQILLGLTPTRAVEDQTETQNMSAAEKSYFNQQLLTTLRDGVLAGTYTVKTVERNGVERLCLRMPHGNVTQDQAADLLRDAAARGEIELPDALSTADGDFDADTLIFNLVQTSLANDGTIAGAQAAKEMSRRAFVASNAKTDKVAGQRIYVVQPGDSLAYLSLQFYGQPSAYPRIYQANRKILRSPDYIQVGQRLVIPG